MTWETRRPKILRKRGAEMAWDGYQDTGAYWLQRQMNRRRAEAERSSMPTRPMVRMTDIPRLTAVVCHPQKPPSLPDWYWVLVLSLVFSWVVAYAAALIRL